MTVPAQTPKPTLAFMVRHPARWVALGFGAGVFPIAPGTVGTLWAWWWWEALRGIFNTPLTMGAFLLAATIVGTWASATCARHLGRADPGAIVWDEIVAMWLILWIAAPASFWGELTVFLLFRFFDTVKPQPVRWADGLFKGFGIQGGFGIMWDDLVAAFCVLFLMTWWRF